MNETATQTPAPALEPAPICFRNHVHDPHPGCQGLDADTLFDRTMDALS